LRVKSLFRRRAPGKGGGNARQIRLPAPGGDSTIDSPRGLAAGFLPLFMEFIRFLRKESGPYGVRIATVTVFAGVVNGLIVAIILGAASSSANPAVNMQYLVMFAVALLALMLAKRYSLNHTTRLTEQIVERLRIRMTDKIRRSELLYFDAVGQVQFMTILTKETQMISNTASMAIGATAAAVMLIVSFLFVAYLSLPAFFLSLIAIGLAVLAYRASLAQVNAQLHETVRVENRFFDLLNHMLAGFKEVKIDSRKNRDLFNNYLVPASREVRILKTRTNEQFVTKTLISHSAFYALLATIIFLLPRMFNCDSAVIIKVTGVMLFVFGPLAEVVGIIPYVARAGVSIETIQAMEKDLDVEVSRHPPVDLSKDPAPLAFQEIKLDHLTFTYPTADGTPGYSVGPLDATIRKGEILFIMGGNGSGKSTFLKLLTGLYFPAAGRILVDGKPLLRASYHRYRNMFSTIFTDFHLFDRVYGMGEVDEELLGRLLEEFELTDKTRFVDGAFTELNLSTGQRKRLSLVIALLEKKDVLIFDEWAADQDPTFRKHFYEDILQDLKRQGKTIIAATHDDRYFHVADRVLKMEWGKFVT
jgi:putative pyoverdin transport system ATP-binding/permease protein